MAVVERISHRVAVMYLGEIVEIGSRASVFGNPQHPYTKRLLSAVPIPDPSLRIGRRRLVNDELKVQFALWIIRFLSGRSNRLDPIIWCRSGGRSGHKTEYPPLSRPISTSILLSGLADRDQAPLDLLQMLAHGGCGSTEVAVRDRIDNPFVVHEAVMISRRPRTIGA